MIKPRELLIQKLRNLEKKGYTIGQIASANFIGQPGEEQREIRRLWYETHKKDRSEKWHQFVRYVFFNETEKQELSKRIARLLLENKNSINEFYKIERESDEFQLPDRLSDFLRFRILCSEYFEIYRRVMRRINFDYPLRKYSDKKISGRIDWSKTIQKSKTAFPIEFEIKTWIRKFNTPENILLILVSYWLKTDAVKILNQNLEEPLQSDEKKSLIDSLESVNQIITRFPFLEVLNSLRKYIYEDKSSEKINSLLSDVKKRIRDGSIRNPQYYNLLEWIRKYLELDFTSTIQNKRKFTIRNIKDIDLLYEIFIFLEFFNFLKNIKKIDAKIMKYSSSKYKIIFNFDGNEIELFHGKSYSLESHKTWALTAAPDYSVEYANQIVAIFDAKNYSKIIKKNTSKRLGGIIDLKNMYDDLVRFRRKYPEVEEEIIAKFLEMNEIDPSAAEEYRKEVEEEARIENEINKDEKNSEDKRGPKEQILSYLANLDVKYGGLIFPKYEPEEQKTSYELVHTPKNVNHLVIETLRLDYDPKEMKKTRENTMSVMFNVIQNRVKEIKLEKK